MSAQKQTLNTETTCRRFWFTLHMNTSSFYAVKSKGGNDGGEHSKTNQKTKMSTAVQTNVSEKANKSMTRSI